MSLLDSLKTLTRLVVDTADIELTGEFGAQDATTNPSLLLKAVQKPDYSHIVDDARAYAARFVGDARRSAFLDKLYVSFGCEILKRVPGRVSTEVDARFSFDTDASVERARRIIALYDESGVSAERVLVKIASTWEGVRAAEKLEGEGIHCNLTLLFSYAQGVNAANAGVTLMSPFVGRIYDWHKKARGVADIPIGEDPGVASVVRIYNYVKKNNLPTVVMGASFRKVEQVIALAGCDLLTVSPQLLGELDARAGEVEQRLSVVSAEKSDAQRMDLDEKGFRWMHNEDPMAVEKLSDGIRIFARDARRLPELA